MSSLLVIDMDNTLLRTDALHEAVLAYLAENPLRLIQLLTWLPKGKTAFKNELAGRRIIEPELLPYEQSVLDLIQEAKGAGATIALVSASDQRQVAVVAEHLGVFDHAIGTDQHNFEGKNLSAENKLQLVQAQFPNRSFDYVGDCAKDIPIWQASDGGYTVGASIALKRQADAANENMKHIAPGPDLVGKLRLTFKAMRPYQWIKNALIFLPMLAAHDLSNFWSAVIAFLCFSVIASSVYIINDMFDLAADRAHPRKCRRPFAAGDLALSYGAVVAFILAGSAMLAAALFTNTLFTLVLGAYLVSTLLYSMVIKRWTTIDVFWLAGLYTIRILAGGAATSVPISPWMLAFSIFFFLSLAAIKRLAELMSLSEQKKEFAEGRDYRASDQGLMQAMALAAGYNSVLVLALYINSSKVSELYALPEILWLICLLILYWISRLVTVTHRGMMTDDPIVFATKDKASIVVGILCVLILLTAMIS